MSLHHYVVIVLLDYTIYIIKTTIRRLTCPHTQTLELHYCDHSNYHYMYEKQL